MSTDIEELRRLIEKEKAAQEKVKKAKEEADIIVRKAREKGDMIIQEAQSDPRWNKLREEASNRLTRQKAEMEEEYKEKASALEKAAQANVGKAIERVVEETLKVEL
jgi:vacuolar-type H+-ATPase subunit H